MIVDLSSNNGDVDFSEVSPAVDKVVVRTSLGYGDVDKNCSFYALHASLELIPLLYYHFAYMHDGVAPVDDATEQAEYFVSCIAWLPAYEDLVIDLEPENAQGDDTHLSQSDFGLWLQTFLDTVKAKTGKDMIIYSYADYLNRHLADGHAFGKYRLWIANYGNVDAPVLPKGWSEWYMWQYCEKGRLTGITTNVDFSKLNPVYVG